MRARAPFYGDLHADLAPGGGTPLGDLPVVTKAMLMADIDRTITVARLRGAALRAFVAQPQRAGQPFGGDCAVWTSSGTSGTPGIFLHDAAALAIYDTLQLCRILGLPAPGYGGPGAWYAGRYALVAATGGHFASAAMLARLQSLLPAWRSQWRTISLMQPVDALVAQLNDFGPAALASYPSAACLLAREQRAGRLHLDLRQVWTGGENLTAAARAAIGGAFDAPVREEYGASEFPSIAVECAAGALHVNADWLILEPVDAAYRPVRPGCASHTVLLTNLANRVQPLIRYDLGDAVTLCEDRCPCGSGLPTIRVHGRSDEVLVFPDGRGATVRLLPLVLTTVLEESAGVHEFQLAPSGPGRLRLWTAVDAAARACAALRTYLDAQGLHAVEIEASPQGLWPPRAGGKFRRIRARMPPAPGA